MKRAFPLIASEVKHIYCGFASKQNFEWRESATYVPYTGVSRLILLPSGLLSGPLNVEVEMEK